MQHNVALAGYADLSLLAEEVGDLRYDALVGFLGALAAKLARDASADLGRGRPRLAASLAEASAALAAAEGGIAEAWRISSPKMAP